MILFMVLLPALLGDSEQPILALGTAMVRGVGFCAAVLFLSRFGIPQVLDAVAKTRSRELFTVTVVGLCAAVAVGSGMLGLSPALGAFAAGVVVSGSIYSHRVLADVLPFKDLFLTVFFVSIGLLIDLQSILENWHFILGFSLLIIAAKGVIVHGIMAHHRRRTLQHRGVFHRAYQPRRRAGSRQPAHRASPAGLHRPHHGAGPHPDEMEPPVGRPHQEIRQGV